MCLPHLCVLGFSPAWTYTGLVHAVTAVVSSYMQFICEFICVVSSYVQFIWEFICAVSRRCSVAVISSCCSYTLCPSTSTTIPEPWDEDAMVLSKTSAQASLPQERISK